MAGWAYADDRPAGVQRRSPGKSSLQLAADVVTEPGRPLDPQPRQAMEAAFGFDFADVRIHDDAHAADSAETLGAAAYTVGSHIAFGSGQYAWNPDGRALLAHELTHVVQQPNVLQARSPRRFAFLRDRAARWAPRLVKRRGVGDFPVPRNGSRPA